MKSSVGSSHKPAQHGEEKHSVAVAAFIFATGTMMSRLLGLVRDMLMARYLSDDVRDAFLNAFRLPNVFRRIFGEGAISSGFIPVYVSLIGGDRDDARSESEIASDSVRASRLLSGVFTILLSTTSTLSLLAIIFMDEIMRVLLNGSTYMSVPGKFELTVRLGRIMFVFLVLISLYGYFMAVLNSLRKFALTAVAPCFFNLSIIAGAYFSRTLDSRAFVIAWAILIGGVVQAGVLVPALIKAGHFPRLTLRWSTPEIKRVFRAVLPSAFGVSILQITALVNMRFAAELESGSHSYLYLADRILELPLSLFVVSVGAALLPTLSRFWAAGDKSGMADTINHYIRLIVFVSLPAALGMFILAQPICEVLFMGREFKYDDAVATAGVIRVYAFTLILASGVRVLAQGFYAVQNTWYPALAGAVALIAHVIFAFALTRAFRLNGLAAASIASSFVNLSMLAIAYHNWIGSLELRRLMRGFLKFAICGAAMVGALQVYGPVHQALVGRFAGARTFSLFGVILLGAAVYFALAHLMRIEEYRETFDSFRTRFRRRLKRN